MTTTLKPTLEALGFADEAQQVALIKLLHAGGAFGDLLASRGVLDDKSANGVLEGLQFTNDEQAARWLHAATQKTMLRPSSMARQDMVDSHLFQQHHDALAKTLLTSGLTSKMQPKHKHYDHVLLLGTTESGVDTRLDTLKHLWEQGVRFDKIHMLGCDRTLSVTEASVGKNGPRHHPIRTEMDMMEARFYAKRMEWPPELKEVRAFEVDTFNQPNGKCADTKDTVESWLYTQPDAGNVLVISNQPLAYYQDAAARAALPAQYKVDTVGAAADADVKISVALDALARQIHVGFPGLLEQLKTNTNILKTPMIAVDPSVLKVDADTYQFRSGGDTNGVTHEQRFNTDTWNPILHGNPILVHERMDGSLFVADGHHRVDLAKRLNEQGKGPGNLLAMVLSEKQGYSATDVKLIAAFRNIAQGTTNVLDTSEVLREAAAPGVHRELLPPLEMNRGNLPLAAQIAELSEPDFSTLRERFKPTAGTFAEKLKLQNQPPAARF
jgi:hypothetical protein